MHSDQVPLSLMWFWLPFYSFTVHLSLRCTLETSFVVMGSVSFRSRQNGIGSKLLTRDPFLPGRWTFWKANTLPGVWSWLNSLMYSSTFQMIKHLQPMNCWQKIIFHLQVVAVTRYIYSLCELWLIFVENVLFAANVTAINVRFKTQTSGQSNLTAGRIAAARGWFSGIR